MPFVIFSLWQSYLLLLPLWNTFVRDLTFSLLILSNGCRRKRERERERDAEIGIFLLIKTGPMNSFFFSFCSKADEWQLDEFSSISLKFWEFLLMLLFLYFICLVSFSIRNCFLALPIMTDNGGSSSSSIQDITPYFAVVVGAFVGKKKPFTKKNCGGWTQIASISRGIGAAAAAK